MATIAGEPFEFAALYASCYKGLLVYLRRALNANDQLDRAHHATASSAEDLAQETWVRVWTNWPSLSFRSQQAMIAYLFTTAQHLLIDLHRRQQMMTRHGEDLMTHALWEHAQEVIPTLAVDEQPEAAVISRESMAELWQIVERTLAIRAGPQRDARRDRAILTACLVDEPQRETAARLGLTHNTLKTRLWRIRALLQERLQERELLDELELSELDQEVAS